MVQPRGRGTRGPSCIDCVGMPVTITTSHNTNICCAPGTPSTRPQATKRSWLEGQIQEHRKGQVSSVPPSLSHFSFIPSLPPSLSICCKVGILSVGGNLPTQCRHFMCWGPAGDPKIEWVTLCQCVAAEPWTLLSALLSQAGRTNRYAQESELGNSTSSLCLLSLVLPLEQVLHSAGLSDG